MDSWDTNNTFLSETGSSHFLFVGRLSKMKAFYAGMKSINIGEYARFHLNDSGLRVHVEDSKCIQTNLFITRETFDDFEIQDEIFFSINMNVLLECISIFASSECSMKMYYKCDGAPLILVVHHSADEDVITQCSLKTASYEDCSEYSLNEESPSFNVIYVRGPDMAHIFSEIDKSAEELEITLSPKEPYFRIATIGVMQSESNIEIAKTSDMILLFQCRDTTVARYKCSHMRLASKGLSVSSKVTLRTDSSGLLEMQFILYSEGPAQVYIQLFLLPVIDD